MGWMGWKTNGRGVGKGKMERNGGIGEKEKDQRIRGMIWGLLHHLLERDGRS